MRPIRVLVVDFPTPESPYNASLSIGCPFGSSREDLQQSFGLADEPFVVGLPVRPELHGPVPGDQRTRRVSTVAVLLGRTQDVFEEEPAVIGGRSGLNVFHQEREFIVRVAPSGVLEVNDPDTSSVPKVVRCIWIALTDYRCRRVTEKRDVRTADPTSPTSEKFLPERRRVIRQAHLPTFLDLT